jgi:hypothetical protein
MSHKIDDLRGIFWPVVFCFLSGVASSGCSLLYRKHEQQFLTQASEVFWHSESGTPRATIVAKVGAPSSTQTVGGKLVDTYYVGIPEESPYTGPQGVQALFLAPLVETSFGLGIGVKRLFHLHSDKYIVTYDSEEHVQSIECLIQESRSNGDGYVCRGQGLEAEENRQVLKNCVNGQNQCFYEIVPHRGLRSDPKG